MSGTVIFLGAGATKACEGPLTSEILPAILYPRNRTPPTELCSFAKEQFHVEPNTPQDQYPGLPLLMSLLDMALDRRQAFHPRWDSSKISELRHTIETGMFELLEQQLRKAPTNNHYQLLQTIYANNAHPQVISTNYDLIIDTAMMYVGRDRGLGDALLPDYHIRFRTEAYAAGQHFGTLLKLHGSLNWLYCRTCQRTEIGVSDSTRYLKLLRKELVDLENYYALDNSPCKSCGTRLRPLLIAPTHFKDYRNPHLGEAWYEAECLLREAERAIFIGYSLPDDDVEVVYLLKRSLAHLPSDRITVVEYHEPFVKGHAKKPDLGDHHVGRRYRTLFGDVDWHPEGLDASLPHLATLNLGN